MVGTWYWDYLKPQEGLPYLTTAIFDVLGTYLEFDPWVGVTIGRWRPTGDRTAKTVGVIQAPVPLDFMFEPDFTVVAPTLAGPVVTEWRSVK